MGARGKAFYRLVVADSRSPRDGRFIDSLGYYDPKTDPPTVKIDVEKVTLWLSRGAQVTETVEALLKKQNIPLKPKRPEDKSMGVGTIPTQPAEISREPLKEEAAEPMAEVSTLESKAEPKGESAAETEATDLGESVEEE